MKRLLSNLAIIAVAIGLAEIGVRFIVPEWNAFSSERFMQSAELPGFRPYLVGKVGFRGPFAQNNGDFRINLAINATGHREDDTPADANGRIWGVGDSYSFGWGVEQHQTYLAVLGRLTGKSTYNLAGPGNDVCGYQAAVMAMPEPRMPVGFVLGLTLENDINSDRCQPGSYVAPKTAVEEPAASAPTARQRFVHLKDWLIGNSALYNFAVVTLKRSKRLNDVLISLGLAERPHQIGDHYSASEIGERVASTVSEIAWLRERIAPETPFVVLLIPALFDIRDQEPFFASIRRKVTAELKRRSIAVVDPYEDFVRAGFEPTHFIHDGHWSPRGHEVVGEALARWFKTSRVAASQGSEPADAR
jgi:hypothetical protein